MAQIHPARPPRGSHGGYRPDIDGLRAIAVLAVLLYHFDVPWMAGGFVGVDVFFVLSGYLIGGILWRELGTAGRIDLARFWTRRVRRLAPAYLAMVVASSASAALILLPFELREFGKEVIAATLWLSNILFYRGAGYFDIGAEARVLLHTWSLSVEEQFYIALPLLLLILRLWARGVAGVLAGLWALSLAACLWITPADPDAAFYLFPFRAWELLTGVLLAIVMTRRGLRVPAAFAWVGLALILGAVVMVRAEGFPGWQATLPVLGTGLILATTAPAHPVLRALSMRGPVMIGLMSYSLYLWHWPVLILSRYYLDGYPDWRWGFGFAGLSVLLAALCWALIERPVRRSVRITARMLLLGSGAAGALVLGLGAVAYVSDGLPGRFAAPVRPHIAASTDFIQDWSRCSTPETGAFAGIEVCAIGPEGAPAEVLIWGDSHLRALMDGLALAAEEEGVAGLIVWHAGCPPLFGLTKAESAATPAEDAACPAATRAMRRALERERGISRVLLVGRWTYYAEGAGIGIDAHNTIALRPAPDSGLGGPDQAGLFAAALGRTVTDLTAMGHEVHLLRQVPEIAQYDSRGIARALAHGRMTEAEARLLIYANPEALAARVARAEAAIMPLVTSGLARLIDPWPALCPERCAALHDGRGYYFDNNHLTNTGARALRDLFRPFLTGTAQAATQ